MLSLKYIPREEFTRISDSNLEADVKMKLISLMCRLNTLFEVKKAGSGHLGSSFSAMDIVVFLYYEFLNIKKVGINSVNRDVYFSSKGHDVPGLYSVLYSIGVVSDEKFLKLRRLGGLDGHPDISIPGIEANTGSLGMGISKGKGIAFAKKLSDNKGRVIVLTGDGEWQEGQNFEALQTAYHQGINNLFVIMDHNKVQSDKKVDEIISLLDFEKKISSFGWHVERCDGHDFIQLREKLEKMDSITDKPKFLICDTIKGRGVSFMEHPQALIDGDGIYKWHSGAPDDDSYEAAFKELEDKIESAFGKKGINPVKLINAENRERNVVQMKNTAEKVVTAYGEALFEIGKTRKDVVVLDADLSADCGLRLFENAFPDNFIENGIAEQDMVSMAGGLALHGYLPIVNSFGVFLASRANEQIYNNATEDTKIIYVSHYAGLIPAGPGKSHQSLRDISLFRALPNCMIFEPGNNRETKDILNWCVNESKTNCMIRLAISPSPRNIVFPESYSFEPGKGTILTEGNDVVLFTYGPVMLNEALSAYENLAEESISVKVINMSSLNFINKEWLCSAIGDIKNIMVVDNHYINGGLGDTIMNSINESGITRKVVKLGVLEHPVWGTPNEVLDFHNLSGAKIALRIKKVLNNEIDS